MYTDSTGQFVITLITEVLLVTTIGLMIWKDVLYARNDKQSQFDHIVYPEDLPSGWILLEPGDAKLHQNNVYGEGNPNLKYVSKNGHYEIAFTFNGERYIRTYDPRDI